MSTKLKWGLVLFLWIYIIWRAYTVPITRDEAYSFFMVKTNYLNALAGTANNHWLNSLGMKIGSLFSDHPFALRVFSILAWLLYGYSAIKISNRVNNSISGFVLLFNPSLIDFFSLARGYGLACAFALACIWKIIEVLENKDWHPDKWISVVGLAALSVVSNYTSLYFFLSVVGVYGVSLLLTKQMQLLVSIFKSKWIWIVAGTSIVAIANLLFIKLYTGDLEYGGHAGFIGSMFGSLVKGSLYYLWGVQFATSLTFITVALVSVSIIGAFIKFLLRKQITPFIFLAAYLLAMLLLNVLFHLAFDTPYLLSRTTLILYPSMVVVVFYFLREFKLSLQWQKRLSIGIGIPALLLLAIHFFYSFNTAYCYEWKEQADTKQCLDMLVKEEAQKVLVHRLHAGTLINYYKVIEPDRYAFTYQQFYSKELEALLIHNVSTTHPYDYALLLPPYNLQALADKHIPFTVLKHFPLSDAIVLKLGALNESQ